MSSENHSLQERRSDNKRNASIHSESAHETECGFFGCHPRFLRSLASVKLFTGCYVLQGIAQFMFYTYWVACVSTVEKRFHLQSQTMGYITSASEIGYITSVAVFAHFGPRGHRPHWLSYGIMLMVVGGLLVTLPELLVPPPTVVATNSSADLSESSQICRASATPDDNSCDERSLFDSAGRMSLTVAIIFSIAWAVSNGGAAAPPTVGLHYLDDSLTEKQKPVFFGKFVVP